LQVDTTGNYVPITFNSINAQIFDLDSDRQIGTGFMGHKRLPPKAFPIIQVPLNFSYVADNDTDPTCKSDTILTLFYLTEPNLRRAELVQRVPKPCSISRRLSPRYVPRFPVFINQNDRRVSGVRFRLVLSIDIAGLPGRQGSTTQTSNANCPIELPQNSA
jgi:hypothetical protein